MKENEQFVPLQDDEGEALQAQIDSSNSIRRSLGQSFISSGKKAGFFSSMANIYSTAVGAGYAFFFTITIQGLITAHSCLQIRFCDWSLPYFFGLLHCLSLRQAFVEGANPLRKIRVYFSYLIAKRMSTLAFHCFRTAGTTGIRLTLILFCLGMTVSYVIVMCTIIEKIISEVYQKPKDTFFSKKFIIYCFISF